MMALSACASGSSEQQTSQAPPQANPVDAGLPMTAPFDAAVAEPPADTAKDAKLVRSMLKKVAARRELEATGEVVSATISRKTIISQIKEHVGREIPRVAIDREGSVMKLLALIPQDLDYEKETFALLEAQIAGYYEPADKHMYLASDLGEKDAAATLAHELVHALQDQHFDLGARSKYTAGQSDRSLATSCLAEGDAMSAMFDVMFGAGKALEMPPGVFPKLVEAGLSTGPGASAPPAMKRSLVAPYSFGTEFVHALRRQGGFALVDEAWKNPPMTTEQILHPEKWKKHEPALGVAKYVPPSDFTVEDEDSGGELSLRIALEEWIGTKDGPAFAVGWGGDHTEYVKRGDEVFLTWQLRFDSAKGAPAKKLEKALSAAWAQKKWLGAKGCFEGPGGNLAVRVLRDDEIVILAGPTNATTRKPSADCAATLKLATLATATPR